LSIRLASVLESYIPPFCSYHLNLLLILSSFFPPKFVKMVRVVVILLALVLLFNMLLHLATVSRRAVVLKLAVLICLAEGDFRAYLLN